MAAAAVVLAACTGGDGSGVTTSTTAPSTTPTVATTAPATTVTTVATTTSIADPAGSVTLRVRGVTLPDLRAGGTGLRVLVRAASSTLTVRRRGAGGGVAACPVAGATAPIATGECVDVAPASAVDVRFLGGVELRATGGDAAVEEVSVTYLPGDRTTTVVTPARPAGACAARPCEATYSLVPGRAGSFALDGRGGGGRPRLVLTAAPVAGGGSNRTLATVEGGGSLSIRATLEAGWEASLLHHEQGPDAVAALTAEISWP